VIDRAKAFSPLNTSLASDPVELVTRIQQMQQRIFTAVASLPAAVLGRSRFTRDATLTSTNAASTRSADLSGLTPPMERLLKVTLASGVEVLPVTLFDPWAQLPPRYAIRGQTLLEISNDWSASTEAVSLSVLYCAGPTAITPTGGTSQTLTIPDEWADLVIKPLAMYFHSKDPGRDPTEYQMLDQEYTQVWNGFLAYVTNYAGELSLPAQLPPPPEAKR
jgi:hypothetical protein